MTLRFDHDPNIDSSLLVAQVAPECCCEPLCGLAPKNFNVLIGIVMAFEIITAIVTVAIVSTLDNKDVIWAISMSVAVIFVTAFVMYILKQIDSKIPRESLEGRSPAVSHVPAVHYERSDVEEEKQ